MPSICGCKLDAVVWSGAIFGFTSHGASGDFKALSTCRADWGRSCSWLKLVQVRHDSYWCTSTRVSATNSSSKFASLSGHMKTDLLSWGIQDYTRDREQSTSALRMATVIFLRGFTWSNKTSSPQLCLLS